MQQSKLDSSPIVYYTSENKCGEWIVFLHAAFVDHKMFQSQIEYFQGKYNILAGYGKGGQPGENGGMDIRYYESRKNRQGTYCGRFIGRCIGTGFRKSIS